MGVLGFVFFIGTQTVSAQFTLTEDFKGNTAPNFVFGDGAYLTSGIVDPANAGWLRLTEAQTYDKGYVFINKTFPSTLGVIIDFEYKMWRKSSNFEGADGFSIFLFDGAISESEFSLGGYGGSLGYAPNTNTVPFGVTGGYIGIGLDAYGNFSNPTEGRNGGPGEKPNSIVLRGPTTTNPNTTNAYLAGKQFGSGVRTENWLDYNAEATERPDNGTFYRRVQIEIKPTADDYKVIVRWATTFGGPLEEVLSYTMITDPSPTLKLGFAAATGGDVNYHEIRNLYVTTPGNLRIAKTANKNILEANTNITYNIEVSNDTGSDLTGIAFEDKLTDGNGNVIPDGMFDITSISFVGFSSGTNISENPSGNSISGVLNMVMNSTGTITVTGTLNAVPEGNVLSNTATIVPTDISDQDMSNNTAVVNTPVLAEDVDLIIDTAVNTSCLDEANGNTFTLTVSNMGTSDLNYGDGPYDDWIIVTLQIPSGASISGLNYAGWKFLDSSHPYFPSDANTYYFQKTAGFWTETLGAGMSLPPIKYKLSKNSGYKNTATVGVSSPYSNPELPNNQQNNTNETIIFNPTQGSIAGNQAICIGSVPANITSVTAGNDGSGVGNISYVWESSIDGGVTWTSISGATQADYQPGNVYKTTHFRRKTIVSIPTASCSSIYTNTVIITVKKCMVISNPALRSRAINN